MALLKLLGRVMSASWGQLVAALVLLLSLRLYSARLAPEDFGVAMLALGMFSLLDGLGSMTFSQVLSHQLKDFTDRAERIGLAFGLGLGFAGWLALLLVVSLILAWFWLGLDALRWLIPAAIIFWLCEVPRAVGMALGLLERRIGLLSAWNAFDALLAVGCSLLFIELTGQHPASLVLGALAGRAAGALVMAPIVLGSPRQWQADRRAAAAARGSALAFGWSIAIMTPLGWLAAFADRYIVGASVGVVEAGVLAALAGAVMRPYGVLSSGLTNLFRPDLLDQAAGRRTAVGQPLRRWLASALALGALGLLLFVLLGEAIANFLVHFPTPGLDRGHLVIALAASQVLVLMTHAFDNRILAEGRSRALLGVLAFALAGGLPLVALGAAYQGAEGAVWGRFGAELLRLAGSAWLVGKTRGLVRTPWRAGP